MLISVIITNYNYESYISECINSVLNQKYKDFEIIIVDDGSTDNSKEIIMDFERKYKNIVRYIFKANGGQASAFNEAFKIAKGEIITFLDADDFWYEDKLEIIAKYHEKYNAIQHNLLINGQKKFHYLQHGVSKQKKYLEEIGFMGTIPTSGLSFKKDCLEEIFPIPEVEYKICADLYFKIMYLNTDDIFSLDLDLGFYRVHNLNNWYNLKKATDNYFDITLNYLNERRRLQGKSLINKNDYINVKIHILADILDERKHSRMVILGMGQFAEKLYSKIINKEQIIGFTSTTNTNVDLFLDKKVYVLDYLINNKGEYDYIVIGSDSLEEIKDILIEKGFKENEILYLKY